MVAASLDDRAELALEFAIGITMPLPARYVARGRVCRLKGAQCRRTGRKVLAVEDRPFLTPPRHPSRRPSSPRSATSAGPGVRGRGVRTATRSRPPSSWSTAPRASAPRRVNGAPRARTSAGRPLPAPASTWPWKSAARGDPCAPEPRSCLNTLPRRPDRRQSRARRFPDDHRRSPRHPRGPCARPQACGRPCWAAPPRN